MKIRHLSLCLILLITGSPFLFSSPGTGSLEQNTHPIRAIRIGRRFRYLQTRSRYPESDKNNKNSYNSRWKRRR